MAELIQPDILEGIADDIKRSNPKLFLDAFTDPEAREVLTKLVQEEHSVVLNTTERLEYVIQEMVGLGIIETIIKDPSVTDISYNGTELVINTNSGKYKYEDEINENYIIKLIQKFANAVDKEFTPKSPILDAQLGNLRLNAVHKVLSPYGTTMALRVSRPKLALTNENFSDFAPMYMYDFFKAAIQARSNIIIAGEVGTGKTEFQKLLLSHVPFEQKIVVIEDVQESHVKTMFEDKDIHSWLTGAKASISDLIKAGLRNNPAWISVAETRGEEAYEMLQAVLSGHNIVTTLHAVNARAIPSRFVNMAKMGYTVDEKSLLQDIYSYFNFGVHIKKTKINGQVIRYLSELVEFRPDQTAITLFKQNLTKNGFEYSCSPYSEDFQHQLIEHQSDYELDYIKEWKNAEKKNIYA